LWHKIRESERKREKERPGQNTNIHRRRVIWSRERERQKERERQEKRERNTKISHLSHTRKQTDIYTTWGHQKRHAKTYLRIKWPPILLPLFFPGGKDISTQFLEMSIEIMVYPHTQRKQIYMHTIVNACTQAHEDTHGARDKHVCERQTVCVCVCTYTYVCVCAGV